MKVWSFFKAVRMLEESHLWGLVAKVALTQGIKNIACFEAECDEAGDREASIESDA